MPRGRLGLDALRQAEDRAVLEVIQLQRDVGLGIFTDGEYRRGSWLTDLAEAVEGFVPDRVLLEWHGPGAAQRRARPGWSVPHCGRHGDSRRMSAGVREPEAARPRVPHHRVVVRRKASGGSGGHRASWQAEESSAGPFPQRWQ